MQNREIVWEVRELGTNYTEMSSTDLKEASHYVYKQSKLKRCCNVHLADEGTIRTGFVYAIAENLGWLQEWESTK